LQVVHANPHYDLQLLQSHENGLEELESQTQAMISGTHPRASTIGAIVEDPEYHQRLLGYVQNFRENNLAPPPLRENVASSEEFHILEQTFGSLHTAMDYFARLPDQPAQALEHILFTKQFPVQYTSVSI
jgi:hypothetical protein